MTPTLKNSLRDLANITPGIDAYSSSGSAKKEALHSRGKSFLRALAKELDIDAGTFDVRSNLGGIAVSGEVTLHSNNIYIQMSESCIGRGGVGILYRSCKGRKDYCGGPNNFIDAADLHKGALPGFIAKCKSIIEQNSVSPSVPHP